LSLLFLAGLTLVAVLPAQARAGSVSAYWISSAGDLFSGDRADGEIGDVMLENDSIAVLVAQLGHTVQYAMSGGNIIDAGSSVDRVDALNELYTYFDDSWPRQADYSDVTIVDDGSGGGPAVVRATGVDSDDPSLTVVTDYSLAADSSHVNISTTVTNTGGSSYGSFELGDAFGWGGCLKFAPGYGFSVSGTTSQAWLAGTSDEVSYGYFSPEGNVWGPHGSAWSDMNVTTASLGPGDDHTYVRRFVVGGRDIASVATLIHEIAGVPVGDVTCTVDDLGSSVPIAGAEIDAFDSLEVIYLQMITDTAGDASTTLPPGDWKLRASAPGFDAEEAWIVVPAGGSASYDFHLGSDTGSVPIGDTLTVIQRPLLNIPALVTPGDTLTIECDADPATTGWAAALVRGPITIPLTVVSSAYDPSTLWWALRAPVPAVTLYELYDLVVTADGGIVDTTENAVSVLSEFKDDYYFLHITDTHLVTHLYYYQEGADTDTSEMADLYAVIDDINVINPEFVLLTGDFVNEGELEEFLGKRYFTRGQRILTGFDVPVYLTAGNHDIGGWDATPMPDGTARRDWWRFFGWKRLDAPPPSAPWYTQNYSFDYGPVHYIALEAYDNYDGWRSEIYGEQSFTSGQMQWLADDLAAASGSAAQVLFYHYDFSNDINLNQLGVDMALWGHIHSNHNDWSHPYDIATRKTCDGARSYRPIRVSSGVLQPEPTLSAGAGGGNLAVSYQPANDGTNWSVTADITNNQDERFENGMVRFLMPKGGSNPQVMGGSLFQVDETGDVAVYYVNVDIQAISSQSVTLSIEATDVARSEEDIPATLALGQNHPNPFNPKTVLSFANPRAGRVRLELFDVRGRAVTVLVDEELPPGMHDAIWDGRDRSGKAAPSGVYLARLTADGEVRTRKILLAR